MPTGVSNYDEVDTINGYQVDGNRNKSYTFQGDSVLDLTDASTPSKATIFSRSDIEAKVGADTVIPVQIHAQVTTEVAADSTTPIVTVQDSGGNSTGLTLTFTDGDAVDDYATASLGDGTATTPVDLTSENLEVAVTRAAADSSTAAGEAKVLVECILVE